nr:DNA repair protein XRCC3 isoform X1 [Megalopta genalis]
MKCKHCTYIHKIHHSFVSEFFIYTIMDFSSVFSKTAFEEMELKDDYFESAKVLKEREKFLTTGCSKFDSMLHGGIAARGITQIYGAANTGKTQLALQLSLTVQLPVSEKGFAAGAVYICTESIFPSRRLQQLIGQIEVIKHHGINGDLIFVEHVSTTEELEICLLQRVPILMSAQKIGLIIVDSIAAPFRVEDWKDESNSRAKRLRTIGQQLHKLYKDDICIVCINQVTAAVNDHILNDKSNERPALGLTWLSMITSSIYLYRIDSSRYACVKSSSLPEIAIPFKVQGSGVTAVQHLLVTIGFLSQKLEMDLYSLHLSFQHHYLVSTLKKKQISLLTIHYVKQMCKS